MISLMPTMPVKDVSFRTKTVEFTGTVITFYAGVDYVLPKEFIGTATYPLDEGRASEEGKWESGPIFRRLKFMALKDKHFLDKAKEQAHKFYQMGEEKPW